MTPASPAGRTPPQGRTERATRRQLPFYLALADSPAGGGPDVARAADDTDGAELMMRVRWGDVVAFEQVVERYWARTFFYARQMVGDRDRAHDVAQEAFTRLWQRREGWKPTGSVGVWLLRTARNVVISEQRRFRVRMRWASLLGREEERRPRTPLQEAEGAELRTAMQRAIRALSPRRREVFTLFHLQNHSYGEIAEIMDIRPQTVANYLQAALADLRVSLAPFFPALGAPEEGRE